MDLITCLLDYPFFFITILFDYFPLHITIAQIWASYDNNINTTTALHMLYMSVVLLKSVKKPLKLKNDCLVKRFKVIIFSIWTFSFLIWIPITNAFGVIPYTLDVNFHRNFFDVQHEYS
ncbi:hypothetical protein BpHYR1_021753 [Brachionus plicatilis]|uniref:Uncharacterized protein n=1 Tax=Brachionus plicatilis TaxID=10195 RepID=A0A3M7T277_BRAPC|nr:hypothetical protein BpHYR1_021753 [Brachionus plicatilis]